jgi:enterochelin esterase-like enzyme
MKTTIIVAKASFYIGLLLIQACSGPFNSGAEDNPLMTDFSITSQYPEGERKLTVSVPKSYQQNPKTDYPVLLHIADDADHIQQVRSIVANLHDTSQIPEIIVVSLHHNGEEADIYPIKEKGKDNETRRPEQYLEYIEKEVMPLIETEYRVSNDRIMTGWSRFGVLPTFALGYKPDLFSGIIVRSSAGVGGYDSILYENIRNIITSSLSISGVFHFSIGDTETQRVEPFNHLKTLFEQSAPDSLPWLAEMIKGAGHSDTFSKGLQSGLVFYFSKNR